MRDIPRDRSGDDVNVRPDLLTYFPVCASQPVFAGFSMAAYAGIEQLTRGAVAMARACQEKEIPLVVIL
jgi:hypothetical protein